MSELKNVSRETAAHSFIHLAELSLPGVRHLTEVSSKYNFAIAGGQFHLKFKTNVDVFLTHDENTMVSMIFF